MSDAPFTPAQEARVSELVREVMQSWQRRPIPAGRITSAAELADDPAFSPSLTPQKVAELRMECLRVALDGMHEGVDDAFETATVMARASTYAAFVLGGGREG